MGHTTFQHTTLQYMHFWKTTLLLLGLAGFVSVPAYAANKGPSDYATIEWVDLIPKEDLDALLNPPDYLQNIADGSAEDQISSQISNAMGGSMEADNPYQRALRSTQIKPEFNNQAIRVPGFIVPLEFDDNQTVTRFFLVPYFGACIHTPPPPPNQIIYASFDKGLKLDLLHEPFWISGTLKTTLTENNIATAAYSISVDSIKAYQY